MTIEVRGKRVRYAREEFRINGHFENMTNNSVIWTRSFNFSESELNIIATPREIAGGSDRYSLAARTQK